MQFRIVRKLCITSLWMLFNMHLLNKMRISCILKQPFQECIAETVTCVWLRLLTIFAQNFVSIVKNNTAALSQMIEPLNASNNTFGRNI